ncbi:LRG1 (YDL240W) [Zygosaccharomyces parabailii]|nr:LRG1 (YDL240W) [Zygosaccharomyces parabailii]
MQAMPDVQPKQIKQQQHINNNSNSKTVVADKTSRNGSKSSHHGPKSSHHGSKSSHNGSKSSHHGSKINRKVCARCNNPITQGSRHGKTTLKALGKYYHEECFTCADCQKFLKPKYFPYDVVETKETILLCQYDYFRRHNLLCHVCNKPLRGLYYTAFGERYDEEHFSCTICGTPCGVKKCFMFQDQLYCKYHFLKYFSKRCSGCHYPISDQYIEFPKGEEIYTWHPECYGIHKYWHVNLSAETLGLPAFPTVKFEKEHRTNSDMNPLPTELEKQMEAFNSILSKTWSVLYKFEEETASCISDMFQYLANSNQLKGISSTALFVLKVECLFKALGSVEDSNFNISPASGRRKLSLTAPETNHTNENMNLKYSKFPRNLSTKIMIYLQLLRKMSSEPRDAKVTVSSFMSVITGLTHFLKLLTRYGLYNALEKNKQMHSPNSLVKFLREVEKNEKYESDPFSFIDVSINATDNCASCGKYIQEDCIQYHEQRWHLHCFYCCLCQERIKPQDMGDSTYNRESDHILCSHCSVEDPMSLPGFKYVSRLAQLIFLLKIALVRSKAVLEVQLKTRTRNRDGDEVNQSMVMQQTYIRTLNDIKRLKSRREHVQLARDKQEARKSVILETAEADINLKASEKSKGLVIKTEPASSFDQNSGNVFSNTKTLTLDDISRIVAAEQARELRPNAFTYFKKLKEGDDESVGVVAKKSGVYYSELSSVELNLLRVISLSLLVLDKRIVNEDFDPAQLGPFVLKAEKPSPSSSFWWRMKSKMNKEPRKPDQLKVFGTPLDILSEKYGVESDLGVGPSKIRIPIIVDELISSLRQMDMSVEGIFRKNGNIRRLKELASSIDSNPGGTPDLSKENAIQLSALLKKFIRELPDPLLTTPLYNIWINAAKLEKEHERQRVIYLVYSILPENNRNVLEVLLSFLCWTGSFSHIENEVGSKMDIHNLSTVITPNILGLPDGNVPQGPLTDTSDSFNDTFAQNEGGHYFLAIEVVDFLITHNEDMGMVPKFLMSLMREVQDKRLEEYEAIQQYMHEKVRAKQIDFSEFEVDRTVKMKHSTSLVTKGDANR